VIGNPPVTSPWSWQASDYQGNTIGLSVTFDGTQALTGTITVHRDAACVYNRLLIGQGPDGTPDTTTRVVDLTGKAGTRSFPLTAARASRLADLKSDGVTAAP
jgi:hypothetical protein